MPSAVDIVEIAHTIAEQVDKLDRARGELRDHPELVADVVDPLVGMLLPLDRVIDTVRKAFEAHGATAVTTFGDQARGSAQAMFVGGLLSAASTQVLGLRNTLMGVNAEASSLVWPEHDPLAAEELSNFRKFLERRERQLDPDSESLPTDAESAKRSPIDRS